MISYGLGETFGLLQWWIAGESPGVDETRFSSIYSIDSEAEEQEEEFELSSESESSELSPSIITNFLTAQCGLTCLGNVSGSIKAFSKSTSLTLSFTVCWAEKLFFCWSLYSSVNKSCWHDFLRRLDCTLFSVNLQTLASS